MPRFYNPIDDALLAEEERFTPRWPYDDPNPRPRRESMPAPDDEFAAQSMQEMIEEGEYRSGPASIEPRDPRGYNLQDRMAAFPYRRYGFELDPNSGVNIEEDKLIGDLIQQTQARDLSGDAYVRRFYPPATEQLGRETGYEDRQIDDPTVSQQELFDFLGKERYNEAFPDIQQAPPLPLPGQLQRDLGYDDIAEEMLRRRKR